MLSDTFHMLLRLQDMLSAHIFGKVQILPNRGVHCRCALVGTATCGMFWLHSGQCGPAMMGMDLMRLLHMSCGL